MLRKGNGMMTSTYRTVVSKLWPRLLTLTVTLLVVAGSAAVVVVGREALAERASAAPIPDPTPTTPVEVDQIVLQASYEITRRISGQVEAYQQIDLAFELPGTIASILVREGDSVIAGQRLAQIDTRGPQAERRQLIAQRAALEARAELARRTAKRQAELRERGFASDQVVDDTSLTVAQLEAEIASLDAGLDAIDVRLAKSELIAPFAGRIATRAVDSGAVVGAGAPVASLIEEGPLRFRAGLPSELAARLSVGEETVVHVNGRQNRATLSHIAPDLDPVTRARTVFFDIAGDAPPARSTGEVHLTDTIRAPGAWVPLSALRPGPRGSWTLMILADGTVGVEAAEIIALDRSRAYVRGTFRDGDVFLTGGTHRLVPGQRARPVDSATDAVAWGR